MEAVASKRSLKRQVEGAPLTDDTKWWEWLDDTDYYGKQWAAYDFLFAFNSNHSSVWCRCWYLLL